MKRIVMIMTLGMMASTAWAQVSLDVVWTDLTFRGISNEAQSVAFNRNRVIAGEVFSFADLTSQVSVRGYNANTGNLAWEDTIPNATAVSVDAAGNDAFAAVDTVAGPFSVLIRSYHQRTGDLQWSTPLGPVILRAFGVRGNRVLLAGYSVGPFGLNGVLSVLDRATGDLLRTTLLEGPPMIPPTDSIFQDFDRTGTDLVVVGTQQRPADNLFNVILRDYRVSDGTLKWETIEPNSTARSVQLANGLVYVSGIGLNAYSLIDGHPVWKTGNFSTDFPIFTVTDTAVFTSFRTDNVGGNYALERRNAFTGASIWKTPIPSEPMRDQFIRGIGIVHGYIVLVGNTTPSDPMIGGNPNQQLSVRVFDEHGTLLLEDKTDERPRAQFLDHAIQGNRIVGVGTLSEPFGGAFVRMYQLLTGVQP